MDAVREAIGIGNTNVDKDQLESLACAASSLLSLCMARERIDERVATEGLHESFDGRLFVYFPSYSVVSLVFVLVWGISVGFSRAFSVECGEHLMGKSNLLVKAEWLGAHLQSG